MERKNPNDGNTEQQQEQEQPRTDSTTQPETSLL